MTTVKSYLSLIKFSHTIFAMPFALIGFFLAMYQSGQLGELFGTGQWNLNKTIGWHNPFNKIPEEFNGLVKLILVLLCMVFARSAAMAFNRYLDRKWDALNPRTAIREIPKGIITPENALTFTIINCVLFIASTFFINDICSTGMLSSSTFSLIIFGKRFFPANLNPVQGIRCARGIVETITS